MNSKPLLHIYKGSSLGSAPDPSSIVKPIPNPKFNEEDRTLTKEHFDKTILDDMNYTDRRRNHRFVNDFFYDIAWIVVAINQNLQTSDRMKLIVENIRQFDDKFDGKIRNIPMWFLYACFGNASNDSLWRAYGIERPTFDTHPYLFRQLQYLEKRRANGITDYWYAIYYKYQRLPRRYPEGQSTNQQDQLPWTGNDREGEIWENGYAKTMETLGTYLLKWFTETKDSKGDFMLWKFVSRNSGDNPNFVDLILNDNINASPFEDPFWPENSTIALDYYVPWVTYHGNDKPWPPPQFTGGGKSDPCVTNPTGKSCKCKDYDTNSDEFKCCMGNTSKCPVDVKCKDYAVNSDEYLCCMGNASKCIVPPKPCELECKDRASLACCQCRQKSNPGLDCTPPSYMCLSECLDRTSLACCACNKKSNPMLDCSSGYIDDGKGKGKGNLMVIISFVSVAVILLFIILMSRSRKRV